MELGTVTIKVVLDTSNALRQLAELQTAIKKAMRNWEDMGHIVLPPKRKTGKRPIGQQPGLPGRKR